MGIRRVIEWRPVAAASVGEPTCSQPSILLSSTGSPVACLMGVLDDRGVAAAAARAGLLRVLGRQEVRHLRHVLGADESVVRVGRGRYRRRRDIVVLTTQRLLVVDKRLRARASIDEFRLVSVASVSVQRSRCGETLIIHTAGMNGGIIGMAHGQAGGLAHALHDLDKPPSAAAAT
jgi:hypothetical protein